MILIHFEVSHVASNNDRVFEQYKSETLCSGYVAERSGLLKLGTGKTEYASETQCVYTPEEVKKNIIHVLPLGSPTIEIHIDMTP